jgi:hypothetical protein
MQEMKETGARLRALVARLQPLLYAITADKAAQRPAPGKWSPKEILGHLCDSASNNQQKFVRTARAPEGHLDMVGYQQEGWVVLQDYQSRDWAELVAFWAAFNLHIAHIMAQLPAAAAGHTISIDGSAPYRLDFIVGDYVEHLLHHARQMGIDTETLH